MSVLTPEETSRVEATVAAVERRTAAEIVVVTVRRSDAYAEVRILAAVVGALAVSAVLDLAWHWLGMNLVLGLQLGAGVGLWFLSGLAPVLRRLVPKRRAQQAVERAAELAFLEHGVFETRDRTGVLILLSELEHRVAILGDKGVHALLHEAGWNELVRHLVGRIRERRAGDGLCEVIEQLSETLAREAPPRADDVNELDNRVRGARTGRGDPEGA